MNNASSSTSKLSPFQILYGTSPIAPVNLMVGDSVTGVDGKDSEEMKGVRYWARRWWKSRRRLCQFVKGNLHESAIRTKRRYDKKRRVFLAEPGDLVLLSVKSHPVFRGVRKLRLRFTGPYTIKSKVHTNAYELEGLPKGRTNYSKCVLLATILPFSSSVRNSSYSWYCCVTYRC